MKRWMLSLVLALAAGTSYAADFFIYPAEGQDREQQEQDEFQCQRFARDQTGFDPMATPRATTAPTEQQGGSLGGAARGALLGTAVGAATGNTRRGAAAGALGGGAVGGMRRRDSNRQQQQWAQQEAANLQRQRNEFNRAFAACLEGRGYTVR